MHGTRNTDTRGVLVAHTVIVIGAPVLLLAEKPLWWTLCRSSRCGISAGAGVSAQGAEEQIEAQKVVFVLKGGA